MDSARRDLTLGTTPGARRANRFDLGGARLAIMSHVRGPRVSRAAVVLASLFAAIGGLTWGALSLAWPAAPVHVHVRWHAGLENDERARLESDFRLTRGIQRDDRTWEYQLVDASRGNIRALVQDARVDDTAHLNRLRFRPEFAQDRTRQIAAYSLVLGAVGSVIVLALAASVGRTEVFRLPPPSRAAAALRSWRRTALGEGGAPWPGVSASAGSRRATAGLLLAGLLAAWVMRWQAAAAFWAAAGALLLVYVGGFFVGALLLPRVNATSWAVIRTIAGLLLTTVGFLLSLVLSLPWFLGPGALVAAAVWRRGTGAFWWPSSTVQLRWDGVVAGILAGVILSPIGITFWYMAPGAFPPVFYNVDTPYFLEKVHALVVANQYPPESLSNVGIRHTYHYGTQAMAALLVRGTGLLPHHAVFLIVLPLLVAGVVAAAVAAARQIAPCLLRSAAVPLLLMSTPTLTGSFGGAFGPQLAAQGFSIDALIGDLRLWGILSNEGQNIGGDFLILGSIASVAAASSIGWALPAFLIGCALLVKTSVGVALFAGFLLAESWRCLRTRPVRLSPDVVATGAVFVATAAAFFVSSLGSNVRVEVFPMLHLRGIVGSGILPAFVLELLWLLLPALVVLTAGIRDPERRSVPLLLMGVAPIVVVNATRLDSAPAGGGGDGGDWLQVLHAVPFFFHAFALSIASRRWDGLGRPRRAAVLLAVAVLIAPTATAAARYSQRLVQMPESGHEFADNRALAEALATIPTRGTIIVTNDLRYPAEHFSRDGRQMQIPALFGHQAFAVNYAYEPVDDRRGLQVLLQQPEWSHAISHAARAHGWTHLLIRKDYPHPTPIPLAQEFGNQEYAVFRLR